MTDFKCKMYFALPKQPTNQFKKDKNKEQALRAYCPIIYSVQFAESPCWKLKVVCLLVFLSMYLFCAEPFHNGLKYFLKDHSYLYVPWSQMITMIFCYQNGSDLLWEKIVLANKKTFEKCGWRPRIGKMFEINRTVYSNSER